MDSVGFALTIALRSLALVVPSPTADPPSEIEVVAAVDVADLELNGVASAAKTPGLLAIWSHTHAMLSADGGRTFQTAVTAPNHLVITRAALSSEGRLYVVLDGPRDDTVPVGTAARLVAVDPSGAQRTLTLPAGEVDALVAGRNDDLAVVLHRPAEPIPELVSASVDGGRTWTAQDVHVGNAGFELVWSGEDLLEIMSGSEASCGGGYQERMTGQVSQNLWKTGAWPLDTPFSWSLGADGFAYAVSDVGCGSPDRTGPSLCAVRAEQSTMALALPEAPLEAFVLVTSGEHTLAQLGSTLVSLDGPHAEVLAGDVPGDIELVGVDDRGRALGLRGGQLTCFAGSAWQRIP